MSASRTLRVPVVGNGSTQWPYEPKYANDGGVDGFDQTEYHDDATVTATFHGDLDVLDAIAAEPDVVIL